MLLVDIDVEGVCLVGKDSVSKLVSPSPCDNAFIVQPIAVETMSLAYSFLLLGVILRFESDDLSRLDEVDVHCC